MRLSAVPGARRFRCYLQEKYSVMVAALT